MHIPDSLAIALWLTGSLWVMAVLAYLFEAPPDLIVALAAFGILSGIAEWLVRRNQK